MSDKPHWTANPTPCGFRFRPLVLERPRVDARDFPLATKVPSRKVLGKDGKKNENHFVIPTLVESLLIQHDPTHFSLHFPMGFPNDWDLRGELDRDRGGDAKRLLRPVDAFDCWIFLEKSGSKKIKINNNVKKKHPWYSTIRTMCIWNSIVFLTDDKPACHSSSPRIVVIHFLRRQWSKRTKSPRKVLLCPWYVYKIQRTSLGWLTHWNCCKISTSFFQLLQPSKNFVSECRMEKCSTH